MYAKDGGLMGIRCVFGERGRCDNGHVQGMSFRAIMDPVNNIELGAKALAYYRDKGGVEKKMVRERNAEGKLVEAHQERPLPAPRPTPAGPTTTTARSTSPRATPGTTPTGWRCCTTACRGVLGVPAPELTVADGSPCAIRGRRPRTADRPVEPRYRVLCDKIGRSAARASAP